MVGAYAALLTAMTDASKHFVRLLRCLAIKGRPWWEAGACISSLFLHDMCSLGCTAYLFDVGEDSGDQVQGACSC